MTIWVLLAVAVLGCAWLASGPARVRWRRARVAARPFPTAWREILRRRVPQVRALPVDLQLQLKRHMLVFLAEKPFIGCRGLVVTDEMRVTIAALACLLLLNRPTDYYPRLRQILLYPGPFVVDRIQTDALGLSHEDRRVLSGESWREGQVILSWPDAREGAAVHDDGHNVVIHEFAHQLDQENGAANGAPHLPRREGAERWRRVFGQAFAELQAQALRGEAGLIDAYGATSPAEFFAVVSEVFFERGAALAQAQPALYAELMALYRVDPRLW